MKRLVVLLLVLSVIFNVVKSNGGGREGYCNYKRGSSPRPHSVSILEFGAVGDGKTSNTLAFQNAIFYLKSFADKGGAQLYVPKGRWLTGSFNLTSHLTLFLDRDAVIIGSQEVSQWPVTEPLPSYGEGIDHYDGRHRSLINGYNLTDVVITGDYGTIDGQGSIWWDWLKSHSLNASRPHLVELTSSSDVVISNLTLLNSPAWGIHPVYSSNVRIQNITIRAPPDSPSTNGIVPDSCSEVCIEDCTISVGYDAISLKSGWDEYGIIYGKPTSTVHITGVSLQTNLGSALAFGSAMSGGISDIRADHLHIHDSATAIAIKTTRGRGGYVKDVIVSDIQIENVHTAFHLTGQWGDHPDGHFDPDAFPLIKRITFKDVVGSNIAFAGNFSGIPESPFISICLSDISLSVTSKPSNSWSCSNVSGFSESVSPEPCPPLQNPGNYSYCYSTVQIHGGAEAL
ncbi:putative polygalacturonase [Acorus gramineus]|uniref:Polygalacturonase n=1 Tax=Acorus gramineus TaxID=55184 RepID=A0AAV9BSL7_ACOGR|nr:putative polygalacturonase [Acorus gramineus]KAK1280705.1 putative polygalacturonase [Acorus gramineus]